jgi:hypothetical protein
MTGFVLTVGACVFLFAFFKFGHPAEGEGASPGEALFGAVCAAAMAMTVAGFGFPLVSGLVGV